MMQAGQVLCRVAHDWPGLDQGQVVVAIAPAQKVHNEITGDDHWAEGVAIEGEHTLEVAHPQHGVPRLMLGRGDSDSGTAGLIG